MRVALLRLVIVLSSLVSCVASQQHEGCQVLTASNGSTMIACRLRSMNLVTGVHWMNASNNVRQEATYLSIECSDPTAFPTALTPTTFAGFAKLESLDLDSCRLSELGSATFRGLDDLRQLRIQTHNSDWPGTSLALTSDVFNDVKRLQKIDLAFNDIRTLPDSLCSLTRLEQLNLTSNRLQDVSVFSRPPSSPRMPVVTCLQSLQVVDMSYNRLTQLPAKALSDLTLLQELHLQGNGLVSVEDASFDGLISLRLVNLAGNHITSLPPGLFASTRQLAELYAAANGLSVLAPGLFKGLTSLLVIDLSDNQLTTSSLSSTTFSSLHRLAVLSLHNNRIARLDATLLADLHSLQILRLDGNLLEALPDGLLANLRNLHTLILSRNRLTQIDGRVFASLSSLALLAVDNNVIEHIDAEAFANATGVRDLNLSGNNLPVVPVALSVLTQLQSLDLGENHISNFDHTILSEMKQLSSLRLLDNAIGNISRQTFASLPSLRILNLSKNQIHHIEQGALNNNMALQAVRFDANYLSDISGIFSNLPNLAWLNISDNRLTHFDYALIPKSLQWLDMHANLIEELGNYYQLDDQLSLQTLDASFNRLTELTASMLPDSLQILSLNDNLISTVQPYTFFRKDNLTRVDLYANHISDLDQNAMRISATSDARPLPEFYIGGNPFQCDCNMEWIQRINTPDHLRQHPRVMDLESIYCRLLHSRQKTYVPLVEATPSNFLCTYETHCFALCHCCDFDACDCEMTCPNNCTCYHDQSWSANIVDCSQGGHNELPERIPMDVTELYLDGSQFRQLASHKFIGRKNLRVLFLNSSGVEIIHNRTFNGLKGLLVLHLEDNRIAELQTFEFSDLESLRELYLHNNVITSIKNTTFSSLKHLEVLRLDGNKLVDFAVWNVLVTSPYLVQLTLNGNPWSCDCAFLEEFRTALLMAGPKVTDAANLVCVSNERDSSATTLAVVVESSTQRSNGSSSGSGTPSGLCVSPTPSATTIVQQRLIQDYLPLLVTTLVVFVVVTLLVLLAFVYRYKMRVWCHARYGLRLWAKRDSVLDQGKLFDAFVSYSAKDDTFVQQMLATNLEYGSPSYKLCLQHRDCPSNGAYLSETIGQAVDSSKRTIMVISQNFMKAEWCRFEYKSALHQLFKNRRKCLLVILIGDIPQKDLDPDLKLYLKTNTYFQWGEIGFWDKLRFAMPDVPRHKTVHNSTQNSQRTRPCHVTIPARTLTLNMSA